MSDIPDREIQVYAICKKGGKYFLLKETGKPDIREPVAADISLHEAFRDLLLGKHGAAVFKLMNDVGPDFGKHLRIAVLDLSSAI
jgi:hypothetical protein